MRHSADGVGGASRHGSCGRGTLVASLRHTIKVGMLPHRSSVVAALITCAVSSPAVPQPDQPSQGIFQKETLAACDR